MKLILKLTFRYMKMNRKRTLAAMTGIILTLTMLSVVLLFSDLFLEQLRNTIIEEEGDYHAVFHELTDNQYEKLKASPKIKNCTIDNECSELHGEGKLLCARVTMKRVNLGIFTQTQRLAKSIGMPKLPIEEQTTMANGKHAKYQVTYHMNLLVYYGIQADSWIGPGMLIRITLLMLVFMGSVLIYNAYSISVFEKQKYLGTLGSVGASKLQLALSVFWEGILEGIVAIPVGICLGFLIARGICARLRHALLYEALTIEPSFSSVLKLTFFGAFMIVLACSFPAGRAIKSSDITLIAESYSISQKVRRITDLTKAGSPLLVPLRLALKNIWARRKNYLSNGIILALSMCLLLDGIAAMRGVNGDYYITDDRKRPELNLWLEVYSKNSNKIDDFYEQVAALPEVTSISLSRELDLCGMLIEPEEIRDELGEDFMIDSYILTESRQSILDLRSGERKSGYWVSPAIIGLDENTFQAYVEKAGYNTANPDAATQTNNSRSVSSTAQADKNRSVSATTNNGSYPVLIDDTLIIRTEDGDAVRSILKTQPGETFSFLYSRYGDMDINQFDYTELDDDSRGLLGKLEEIREGHFQLIGTTAEAPPEPYYSGASNDIDTSQDLYLGIFKIYMSMNDFEALLNDPAYKDTYGPHNGTYDLFYERGYKSIPTYIKFDIERKSSSKHGETSPLQELSGDTRLAERIREDEQIEEKIFEIARKTGLSPDQSADLPLGLSMNGAAFENNTYFFGSRAIWQKEQYFHSEKFLQLVLGYGVILLIAALCLSNILQNISMGMRTRRREFAIYSSMGMEGRTLRCMLLAENSLYGVFAGVIGIPISLMLLPEVFNEFSQFRIIRPVFPTDMLILEFIITGILIIVPVIHTLFQMRHLNVIGSIQTDII